MVVKGSGKSFLRNNYLRNFWHLSLIVLLLGISYLVFYWDRTLPNTTLAKNNLSGKRGAEVKNNVFSAIDEYENKSLVFEVAGEQLSFKSNDLGIHLSRDKTLDKVVSAKHSDYLGNTALVWLKAPFIQTKIVPSYGVDYQQLEYTLENGLGKFETRAKNATIVLDANEAKIVDSRVGTVVDKSALILSIRESVESLSSQPIKISLIGETPQITYNQALRARDKAKTLEQEQIVLAFGLDKWTLSAADLFNFLKFYPYGYTNDHLATVNFNKSPISVVNIEYEGKKEPPLEVSLDREKIDDYLFSISKVVDRPTVNATLRFDNGRVVEFTPAQDGQKLDVNVARRLLQDKISIDDISTQRLITINLPVKVNKATIANDDINNLGIRELIGRGISYFEGAIPNRAFNIGLGASLITGTIVKPQDVFSFDKLVGPVSAEQGFKQAYVISKGRTVLDDGGGICQVSTTVFRAALNTGLPIVERTAHAYRVGYYEQRGFKPGFDATIWSPTVDLKFKNDTDHSILVQAVMDRTNAKLQVDIYGTSDGRRVEISDATVSNVSPPPPPKYEDDATLRKGTVKQVDFEAYGATSIFGRKVYKGDQVLIDETIKSYFKPWQAVYLVGTGG